MNNLSLFEFKCNMADVNWNLQNARILPVRGSSCVWVEGQCEPSVVISVSGSHAGVRLSRDAEKFKVHNIRF